MIEHDVSHLYSLEEWEYDAAKIIEGFKDGWHTKKEAKRMFKDVLNLVEFVNDEENEGGW